MSGLVARSFILPSFLTTHDCIATGGSSALNHYVWIKPPIFNVDAFERLGNPGWNWEEYQKYTLKVEQYVLHSPLPIYRKAKNL